MLIGIPPQLSVSKAVQYLKDKRSHRLLTEYAVLRERYWGQPLWARGYWVASSGSVTDEVWQEYIKNQTPPEPADDLTLCSDSRRPNGRPI
jgi:putative transposase